MISAGKRPSHGIRGRLHLDFFRHLIEPIPDMTLSVPVCTNIRSAVTKDSPVLTKTGPVVTK